MSDPQDRDRSGKRRRRKDRPPPSSRNRDRDSEHDASPATSKPPAIILGLAKPSPDQVTSSTTTSSNTKLPDKPIVVLKYRDDNRQGTSSSSSYHQSSGNIPGEMNITSNSPRSSSNVPLFLEGSTHGRLAPPVDMKHSIKLIDDTLRWCDNGMEVLMDQTDYLVIGAIGLQGSGKSTILSLLGGNCTQDTYRNYIFQPQTKETKEDGSHQTNGVDMFVSSERVIFLDTQPVLSSSLLDNLIRSDKKYPSEYSSAENCIDMQSLQIATFMFTVCHVVLVVQDWFTDINFLRFIQNVEMLKPSTPSTSGLESAASQDDKTNYYPHVVFVQNKSNGEDFSPESVRHMQQILFEGFQTSSLKTQGNITLSRSGFFPGIKNGTLETDINLFHLPTMEYYKAEQDSILNFLPDYRGFPSFNSLIKSLRNQLFSITRMPLTQANLSEKNWFHYAARTWDAVKKSQLLADYNRLLP